MNILMVVPRFPYPPDRGDAVRAWEQLRYLSARHRVVLAACTTEPIAAERLSAVRPLGVEVLLGYRRAPLALARGIAGFALGGSLQVGYFARGALRRAIEQLHATQPFDAVLIFGGACAPLAAGVQATRRVLDLNDVDSAKYAAYARRATLWLRPVYALEARRLAACERTWLREHDLTLVVNTRERRKLVETFGAARAAVLRTTVPGAGRDGPRWYAGPADALRIGTVGSMFYPPNVAAVEWFGRHVWPRVRAVEPRAEWWIIGNRPTPAVRRWAQTPGVRVTGRVESIEAELAQLRVLANPVFGDLGVQTKTLCAFAIGTPSVVSADTAAGLDFERARPPFLIAQQPQPFADACLQLLREPAQAEALSQAARRTAARFYSAERELALLEAWLRGRKCGSPLPMRAPRENARHSSVRERAHESAPEPITST